MAGRDQAELDRLMAELLAAYERADRTIRDQLRAVGEEEVHARRRRRLRELQATIEELRDQLDADARAWVDKTLPQIYGLGGAAFAAEADAAFTFNQAHRAAIKALADDAMRSLLRGNANIVTTVKRLVRASTKEVALDKLLLGRTAVDASRELRGELATRGVTAMTYKNGSKHSIGDYADMVIRTTTARAYNLGTLNEAKATGVRYAVCSDGAGCGLTGHNVGESADGKIYPLGTAMKHLVSHPRCRRAWSPLLGVTSRKQADDIERSGQFSRRAEQVEDERRADVVRATRQRERRARQLVRERRTAQRRARIQARSS